jgi:hypothetical protein
MRLGTCIVEKAAPSKCFTLGLKGSLFEREIVAILR